MQIARRAERRYTHRVHRLALLLALTACASATPATTPAGTAVVESVVDGDTIDVVVNGVEECVRLLGIDTHKTWVKQGHHECFGPETAR